MALALAWTALSQPGVLGQATLSFNNNGAPVYAVDGVTRLSGAAFAAQLYVGPTADTLTPAGSPTPFRIGAAAGSVTPQTVTLVGVPPGGAVHVEMRAWETAKGASYEEAWSAGGPAGRSSPIVVTTGGDGIPPSPPAPLTGLASFTLQLNRELIALFEFEGDYSDSSSHGSSFQHVNVEMAGGTIYLNGIYDLDAEAGYRAIAAVPELNYNRFTVSADVRPEFSGATMPLLYGGYNYRWLGVYALADRTLSLHLNNHAMVVPLGTETLELDRWYRVTAAVDVAAAEIRVYLNGTPLATVSLPSDFVFHVMGTPYEVSDKRFMFADYSNGSCFQGRVGSLAVLNWPVTDAEAAAMDGLPPVPLLVTNEANAGEGSLRQAIADANSIPGTDTVTFAIPGEGPHVIQLASELPAVTEALTVDGYTQAGSSPNSSANGLNGSLQLVLNGESAGFGAAGLRLQAVSCVVRGLVIQGFNASGIVLTAADAVIAGNFIGTDSTGTSAVPNEGTGIELVGSHASRVGGLVPADRNLISGNGYDGITLSFWSEENLILGNLIGADATGLAALPNLAQGIRVYTGSSGNILGGATAGARNVISGNGDAGVQIQGSEAVENVVEGNLVGTGVFGIAALGNTGPGVRIDGGSQNEVISNSIAHNGGDGVEVVAGDRNLIRDNRTYSNGGLGIDLGADGATPDDAGDADAGPNQLQNTPELAAASVSGGVSSVSYRVDSLPDNSAYPLRIEFFAADSAGEEGQRFLHADTYEAVDAGQWKSVNFTVVPALPPGSRLIATATDSDGNTSEFSSSLPAYAAPVITAQPISQTGTAGEPVELNVVVTGDAPLFYQWRKEGVDIAGATESTLTIDAAGVGDVGRYSVVVWNPALVPVVSQAVPLFVSAGGFTYGGLWRETFGRIESPEVESLLLSPLFPDQPAEAGPVDRFESPGNEGFAYGERVRGVLTAPVTGDYVFYVAADDTAELYLSTDATPGHKALKAQVRQVTGPRVWVPNTLLIPDEAVHSPETFYVEAEDFDFGGGQFIPGNGTGMGGAYWGGAYEGRSAVAEIDYHDPPGNDNASQTYRTADQGVEVRATSLPWDNGRGEFDVAVDYQIGWCAVGDWFNYTREFPSARDYFVFVRMSTPNLDTVSRLDEVVSGAGTTTQSLVKLGEFRGGYSHDYDHHRFVPLVDDSGALRRLTLGGTRTLRLTVQAGSGMDLNYLAFVPAGVGTPDFVHEYASTPVFLVAGQQYYIEALMKQGYGDANLAVAWQKPGDPVPAPGAEPIPAAFLAYPNVPPAGLPTVTSQPQDAEAFLGGTATFSVVAEGAEPLDYQWQFNEVDLPGQTDRVLQVRGLTAGQGGLYRVAVSNSAGKRFSDSAQLSVKPYGLLQEIYRTVSGDSRAVALRNHPAFPDSPTTVTAVGAFEAPSNQLRGYWEKFGQRLRGYLLPPEDGDYTFYLASDDGSELYLSPDSEPAHKQLIASQAYWSPKRDWTSSFNRSSHENISAPVRLRKGGSYYIEVLMREGGGSEHVAVAWQKPGDPVPAFGSEPIPGEFLRPPDSITAEGPARLLYSPPSQSVRLGERVQLVSGAAGAAPVSYQWQRNGVDVPGATDRVFTIPVVEATDLTSYRVRVQNALGTEVSAPATLTGASLVPVAGPIENPANGHFYYLLDAATWASAELRATELGGHLVTINDAAENDWVFTTFSTYGGGSRSLLTGLYDPDPVNHSWKRDLRRGEFAWASGEPVGYTRWAGNEPNTWFDNEIYGELPATWGGYWNDIRGELHSVVIEANPGPPVITGQPVGQIVSQGANVTLRVAVTGTPPITFQWRRDGEPIPDATGAALNLFDIQPDDGADYEVLVSNSLGWAESDPAHVGVHANEAPTLSAIGNVSIDEDQDTGPMAFTVGDDGTPPGELTFTTATSNAGLVPLANILLGGAGTDRTVSVTPAPDQVGSVEITLGVTDGEGRSAFTRFVVEVRPVNDAPAFSPGPATVRGYPGLAMSIPWATDVRPGPDDESSQAVEFVIETPEPGRFTSTPVLDEQGRLTFTLDLESTGPVPLAVRLQDDGGTAAGGEDTSAVFNLTLEAGCTGTTPATPAINLILSEASPLMPAGGRPADLAIADLDGDRLPEIVVAGSDGAAFVVYRNVSEPENPATSAGTAFAAPASFGTGSGIATLALADFDRDGSIDVAVNRGAAGVLSVFRNAAGAGGLAFDAPVDLSNPHGAAGGVSSDVVAGDLDRDGNFDLAVVNPQDGALAVFLNESTAGSLGFADRSTLAAGSDPRRLALGDLDADGRLDIVVASFNPPELGLFRNVSDGGLAFENRVAYVAGATPLEVVVADLDRDGKPEVLAAAPELDGLQIWLNSADVDRAFRPAGGDGSFAEPIQLSTGCGTRAVAVAEFDGDGLPDVVVASFDADTVNVLGNASQPGQLAFDSRGRFPTARGPAALALGDFSNDGLPDVAIADHLAGLIEVRRNRSLNRAPQGGASMELPFTVSNGSDPVDELVVTAISGNESVVQVSVTGAGADRTLHVTPVEDVSGVVTVTVRACNAIGTCAENMLIVLVGCPANTLWPDACPINLSGQDTLRGSTHQTLNELGEGRWFRFAVEPESQLHVILSELGGDYDLFVFQDIEAAYNEINGENLTTDDLAGLNARYAPAAYSPAAYSPAAYSPVAYSPAAYSPAAYSPAAYSPMVYSPAAYSPAAYSPAAYSPAAYSPAAYSPAAYSPAAYSGAQTRSLVAVSAFDGTANEGIVLNTWNTRGNFYVCVRGRDGAYDKGHPFRLDIYLVTGKCGSLVTPEVKPRGDVAGGYHTLVLTDSSRLNASASELAALHDRLQAFVGRPEVRGVIVDLATEDAIRAANQQADKQFDCVLARNLVARGIRELIEQYRAQNPLEYLVLVGDDQVIPNFRYPDQTPLGSERNFVVPVRDSTTSQAALRLGYFMSQDAYGAPCEVEQKFTTLPIPSLAVGRLVESVTEMTGMIEAYLALKDGELPLPQSSLVTGYEFLADVAELIHGELRDGIGAGGGQLHEALIAPATLSPKADPATTANWSAAELAGMLLDRRHDVIFLAGHYNDGSALAADYETELTARELSDSPVDLVGSLVFGAGCHVGYNTVDAHGIPDVTQSPDWAQAFARKRATFIGGYGYQYGDTELVEYSERLYLDFTRQLRAKGDARGFVSIGKALVNAKRQYLNETEDLRGIHEKAVLQVAMFGLPMLKLNLPGKGPDPALPESIVAGLSPTGEPGDSLGLRMADVRLDTAPLAETTRSLPVFEGDGDPVTVSYLSGAQGNLSRPGEPVLPLLAKDVTPRDATGTPLVTVLRGVGFRGGTFRDQQGVFPLTGTPATEYRGSVVAFQSPVFHPVEFWNVNYFGAICSAEQGTTRLNLFPAQYRTAAGDPATGTRRIFSSVDLRLFYSGNVDSYETPGNPESERDTPALADAPAIVLVTDEVDGDDVTVHAQVVGSPAAGIQAVWITYMIEPAAPTGSDVSWLPVDLVRDDPGDQRLWSGTLSLPASVGVSRMRYAVHAVNGVGLVTSDWNRGAFYTPRESVAPPAPTSLTFDGFPLHGHYGEEVTLSAVLASASVPLAGRSVAFGLASQRASVVTDAQGRATARFKLLDYPSSQDYTLQATFGGNVELAPASASTQFDIRPRIARLSLQDLTQGKPDLNVVATLLEDDLKTQIAGQPVFFVLTDSGGNVLATRSVSTDYAGNAAVGVVSLGAGTYRLTAAFNAPVPLPNGGLYPFNPQSLDPRYTSASQTGTYTFELVPASPTLARAEGRLVKVSVATLLAAATGVRAESLVSVGAPQPDGAQVSVEESGQWIIYEPAPTGGAGSFRYTIADRNGTTATGTVQVTLLPPDDSQNFSVVAIDHVGGTTLLTFVGVPGLVYHVEATGSLEPPIVWTRLGSVEAGPNGEFPWIDTDAHLYPTRFYRTVGP